MHNFFLSVNTRLIVEKVWVGGDRYSSPVCKITKYIFEKSMSN